MTFLETHALNTQIMSTIENKSFDNVLDYLCFYHTDGFYNECDVFVNNTAKDSESFDDKLYKDDIVVLVHHQGVTAAAVGGSYVLAFFVNVAISAAASYAMAKLFPPEIPDGFGTTKAGNRGGASSVYSLNSQQNEAKTGQSIPIIYGKVRTYPALIAPPYRRFEDNEEYLYQLMCVGQGTYSIDKMMISDTDVNTIQSDFFRYEQLEYDDFDSVGGIEDVANDTNYRQLVKTISDVDNLEIRGTPQNKTMIMRFSGSTIEFFPYADGSNPDLSSLAAGSTITISDTLSNNGVYTVQSVAAQIVTVQSHTFVTEPTDSRVLSLSGVDYTYFYATAPNLLYIVGYVAGNPVRSSGLAAPAEVFKLSGTTLNDGIEYQVNFNESNRSNVTPDVNAETVTSAVTLNYYAKAYSAEFVTSYGDYVVKEADNTVNAFEIDFVFPNGIYNTDTSGNFTNRTVEISVTLLYSNSNPALPAWVESFTAKDNSPIRVTKRYAIDYGTIPIWKIRVERITAEPVDSTSIDKCYMRSVKSLFAEITNEPLGNITLLWAKIRATNAISSIGQFALNAWVTRTDVDNTVKDVLTDIYTNDVYGGRLAAADLELADTPDDIVNGAYDSKLTVMDAMTMAAKSNRYSVYPVGQKIQIKLDSTKPVRSGMFNETNIIQDTLKISYNFSETIETDSVKITYRSPEDFKLAEAIYPAIGENPEILELWGCTDSAIALSMATYLYKQGRSRRKIVEFKTDLQGLLPQFYDRIGVSHNMPEWGVASQVIAVNGTTVTLDDEIEAGYDSIIFRKDDGSVSDILALTGSGYDVTVALVPAWVHGYGVSEPTKCSIGKAASILQDFLITSIKPDGKTVLIEGVNYDESIYS